MNITYPVKKVRGHSRRSQVLPGNAPRDEGKNHQWVLLGSSKVESMEPGTVISRAEKCRRWGQ